jgi:hypothetical protein
VCCRLCEVSVSVISKKELCRLWYEDDVHLKGYKQDTTYSERPCSGIWIWSYGHVAANVARMSSSYILVEKEMADAKLQCL